MTNKQKQSFSKYLSYILRHNPGELGLKLQDNGWLEIELLLNALNKDKEPIYTMQLLEEIVAEDNKQRYSISGDGKFIRANQGHSIKDLKMDFKIVRLGELPDTLYHGTSQDNANKIFESGEIKAMERQLVHLSGDIQTATKVGKRHGKLEILHIDAKAMVLEGYVIYMSDNNIYLVNKVPVKFITKREIF